MVCQSLYQESFDEMRMFVLFSVMLTLLTIAESFTRKTFYILWVDRLKKDFYYSDGTKHSRGSVKGAEGEWRDRTRKHRYLMVFDKKMNVLWR